jgi:hypothetical protein
VCYAECHFAECRNAEYRYAERRYAKFCYAEFCYGECRIADENAICLTDLSENAAWSESKMESPISKTQKTPGGVVVVELTK